MASETINVCIATYWLEEDNLMLLECWARDGYTFQDIANKIGVSESTLKMWRKKYPEINEALRKGREIIDYKVENALLKSALGYKTKEVKVTTIMRHGKVIETQRETLEKTMAPNVSACQCWLYNRLPKKWKNMNSRSNFLEEMSEDTSIQVTVTRASKGGNNSTVTEGLEDAEDMEWQEDVNSSIEIKKASEDDRRRAEEEREKKRKEEESQKGTQIENDENDERDLDYWPEDWEDLDDDAWEE